MKKVQKPSSVTHKYPKKTKKNRGESLEETLRRVLTLGEQTSQLTIANVPRPRRQEIVSRYYHWRNWRRSVIREDRDSQVVGPWKNNYRTASQSRSQVAGTIEPDNVSNEDLSSDSTLTSSDSASNLRIGDISLSAEDSGETLIRNRANQEQGDNVMSQNDSIIWNNRSNDQISNEIESNLSLVVNPPSSISQHEDSVASDDSQYTRSSQLDLALEDERKWVKYRIDNLTRDECIITCVLAQMMLSPDELPGTRDLIPCDEESKQSLLYLSYGGHWEINNLRTVLDLAEFLPVGLRRLCGLGVRDCGSSSRKVLEGRLEQCLDLTRRLNLQTTT